MRRKPSRRLALPALSAIAAALALASPVLAQSGPSLDTRAAQVTRGAVGRPLFTLPGASARQVSLQYLRARGRSAEVLASLRVAATTGGANGVTHVRFEQVADGLPVHGAYFKAAVNARGELVQTIDRLAAVTLPRDARIDAQAALLAAMSRVHPDQTVALRRLGTENNVTTFDGGPFFHSQPTVTAVAIPLADGTLARGWLVETWTRRRNLLHHTVVDGDGRVLAVEKRTANDSYNVYLEDPSKGPQSVQSGPAPGGVASPAGWLGSGGQSTIEISGNNVHAYLDSVENNQPDRGGAAVTTGNFLTAADLNAAPTLTGNQAVAVQNLFYLNNRIHDILYGHGFTESAGNFQDENFGRGGTGRDAVQAEAQDGSGTDNADFATPPDGRKPRMQMFLWTGAGRTHEVQINTVPRSYAAAAAEFGPALTTTGVTGDVVVTVPADGCASISTPLAGKLALIDRGTCDFSLKALNAQSAGAIGVIVANNQGGTAVIPMGAGEGVNRVRIPAVMISQVDGAELKTFVAPNATARKLAVQPRQIDASLDADVVFHEYGHGLTWRMIGGMSGPLAAAIGEGAADGIAMLVNGDDRIGEYSSSNPLGIRRNPYEGYPRTYRAVNGASEHDDGEIYGAIVWKLIGLFGETRRADLFRYVVDGMNYTQFRPAYEHMRDGILAAVANGPAPTDCTLVWQAFAQFGVGVGATGVVNSNGTVTITESTAVPADCTQP